VNVTVDASEFIARASALLSGVDRAAVEAIRAATLDVFRRCYTEPPTVPMRTGALRGSGGAYVQGMLVQRGDGPDTYAPPPRISVPPGYVTGTVAFNAPYAAIVHEGINMKNFTTPGSGPKYLESKLRDLERFGRNIVATLERIWR
jgi:hypothetical protein